MAVAGTSTAADAFLRYVNLSSVAGVEPITVDRGAGAELWDVDGRRYLDCFAGISVVSTGHSHPRVVAAAREQMERFIHCGTYLYQVPVVGTLAQRLAEVDAGTAGEDVLLEQRRRGGRGRDAPGPRVHRHGRSSSRSRRASTGAPTPRSRSPATASASSTAGRTSAASPSRRRRTRRAAATCGGRCTLRCADAVEDVINYHTSGNVAAFIAEPILGEAGIVVPPAGYFRRVKEILDRHGILLIVDEVQTGFGRTGRMFGIEHYGVEPDIMTMAKGIASGFPLGGFIARPEIADSFQPGEHLSTFGGNPVACAAAVATLDVIADEHLVREQRASRRVDARRGSSDAERRASRHRRGARQGADDRRRAGRGPRHHGPGRAARGAGAHRVPRARADRRASAASSATWCASSRRW